ncbi:hypothetical protein SAMN04488524_3572 [Pedobacter africanus]|uniref:Uncharacterized protein n=1 Tax=Pedobacter africanus TaxID=151894 RepID=A0A1W2DBL8_9SPHI|nr:hypothetical protein SAMN04488524_3572 [Pedobacter africanus]
MNLAGTALHKYFNVLGNGRAADFKMPCNRIEVERLIAQQINDLAPCRICMIKNQAVFRLLISSKTLVYEPEKI